MFDSALKYDAKIAADLMSSSLTSYALLKGVSLEGLNKDNWQEFLDEKFQDGGEARSTHFLSFGYDYAYDFGMPDEPAFEDVVDECVDLALEELEVFLRDKVHTVILTGNFNKRAITIAEGEKVEVLLPSITSIPNLRWYEGDVRSAMESGPVKVKWSKGFPAERFIIEAAQGHHEIDFTLVNMNGAPSDIVKFTLICSVV